VQQEELQQTNEELEERSALLEEKNIEIQKKAEELELTTRYKSEFLANMSHELRTPLNSILLLSRLLAENEDKNLTAEQIEYATVIQSSGNGLLGLIDEILDLSKIEAGKMELDYVTVSIKEICDDMKTCRTGKRTRFLGNHRKRRPSGDRDGQNADGADLEEPGFQCIEIHRAGVCKHYRQAERRQ
jgi:K+-sensing histidine kinase KdpD